MEKKQITMGMNYKKFYHDSINKLAEFCKIIRKTFKKFAINEKYGISVTIDNLAILNKIKKDLISINILK
tara:strand:+ start:190 stop:399 length:210 start_codon:yes stop_codon:yes gene_type:complete